MVILSLSLTTCICIIFTTHVSLFMFIYNVHVPVSLSCLAYITLSLPLSTYHNAPITVSLSKFHNHFVYHNATINVTMPQSLSRCLNLCHTISTNTCVLKYIPRNNHPSISFGSSTFTSYTFPKY